MSKELLKYQIMKTLNGSRLYGTHTETSDDDYISIFVEPPEYCFSLQQAKTIPLHDRGPEEKNVHAEVDGIAYPLRHFLKLATDGNPSILTVLFAQPEHLVFNTKFGDLLLENKELFVSKKAGPKFLGYMNAQLLRLQGDKKGHIPSRPELVEKFGYDTKYAMQIARLAIQGMEFLSEGNITLPTNEFNRATLLGIRNGEFSYDDMLDYLRQLEDSLKSILEVSELPEKPNYEEINKLSRQIHEGCWEVYL